MQGTMAIPAGAAATAACHGQLGHRLLAGSAMTSTAVGLVYPVPLLVAVIGFVLIYLPRRGWRPTAWKVTTIVIGFALVVGSFVPPATVIYLDYSLSPLCQGTFHYDQTSPEADRILATHREDCSDHM
jgi:hypothetical protein